MRVKLLCVACRELKAVPGGDRSLAGMDEEAFVCAACVMSGQQAVALEAPVVIEAPQSSEPSEVIETVVASDGQVTPEAAQLSNGRQAKSKLAHRKFGAKQGAAGAAGSKPAGVKQTDNRPPLDPRSAAVLEEYSRREAARKEAELRERDEERTRNEELRRETAGKPRPGTRTAGLMRCPTCEEPQAVNRKGYFLEHNDGQGRVCPNRAYAAGWRYQQRQKKAAGTKTNTASVRIVPGGAPGLGRKN